MKRSWSTNDGPRPSALIQQIGRAHLDEAEAAGRIAGRDIGKTIIDCPFRGSGSLMTAKAWEKGFRGVRTIDGEPK